MEQKELHVLHFRSKLGSIWLLLLATKGRRQGEGPAAGSDRDAGLSRQDQNSWLHPCECFRLTESG